MAPLRVITSIINLQYEFSDESPKNISSQTLCHNTHRRATSIQSVVMSRDISNHPIAYKVQQEGKSSH